jgi:predicted DNA-binding ribbon-helix-helix protein
MQSAVIKRSIIIGGHKTSVSLEDEFWNGLKEIGKDQNTTLSTLVGGIDTGRTQGNLSSAIRLFVLSHYRKLNTAPNPLGDAMQKMSREHRSLGGNGQAFGHAGPRNSDR